MGVHIGRWFSRTLSMIGRIGNLVANPFYWIYLGVRKKPRRRKKRGREYWL